jgi:hypothetical protein
VPDADEEMIARLHDLSAHLEVPDPADQRAAVRARLEAAADAAPARPRQARRIRRWVAAVAAATVCGVLVTPPARAAVVDAVGGLLRIAGFEVRRDPAPGSLPTSPAPLPSTGSASLDAARRSAKFSILLPTGLGPPVVTVADPDPDGAPRVVTATYQDGRVRLDAFDGSLGLGFMKSAPAAQWVEIDGRTAIWLPGPHPVTYVDRFGAERTETARLAGPTLIWQGAAVSYRLEGMSTLEEALEVADSLE